MIQEENSGLVCGYHFQTEADTNLARQEEQRVALLELKMDYQNVSSVAMLYEKAIRNQVFVTPVGIAFLHKVQLFLQEQERPEGMLAIPVAEIHGAQEIPLSMEPEKAASVLVEKQPETDGERATVRKAVLKEDYDKKIKKQEKLIKEIRLRYRTSFFFNIILIGLLIAMFAIALTGENANVLNYKRVLTNQYASWEEELSEREKAVKEKEQELKIETENSSQF